MPPLGRRDEGKIDTRDIHIRGSGCLTGDGFADGRKGKKIGSRDAFPCTKCEWRIDTSLSVSYGGHGCVFSQLGVLKVPGQMADDEHDRDGDGGSGDPGLSSAKDVLAAAAEVL